MHITSYLAIGIVLYIVVRTISNKGSITGEKVLTERFRNLVIFSFAAIAFNALGDALKLSGNTINFFDWLNEIWLFLKYFVQIPLWAIAGYHFVNYVYDHNLITINNIKINHFALAVFGCIGYGVWKLFYYFGLTIVRNL